MTKKISPIKYIQEATLEDSYIFATFNNNKELTTEILKYIKSAVVVEESMIEDQMSILNKSKLSPLLDKVFLAFKKGEIEILYNTKVKVRTAVPFVVRRDHDSEVPNAIKATIFISNYSRVAKDGVSLTVDPKKLYTLMESAFIALNLHKRPIAFSRSMGLMKLCNYVYLNMFMRLLSKEFALTLDKNLHDDVVLSISRFFLERVWDMEKPELIFSNAVSNIKDPNIYILKNTYDKYTEEQITDITKLLLFLKGLSPRLESLSVKYIIQKYLIAYHGPCVLSIDYLPYMFFIITNVLQNGFMLNDTLLGDIIKTTSLVKNYYPELSKIII